MAVRLRRIVRRPQVIAPVVLVVVVGCAAGAWAATRGSAGSGSGLTTTTSLVTAQTGNIQETVSASGTIAAASTADLDFATPGTVTAVNVQAGSTVTAGEVLATVDSTSLANSVAQAQASVASDTAKVDADQSDGASSAQLAADRATLTSAEAQLAEAQQNLSEASLVSPISGTVNSLNLTVGQQVGTSSGGSGTGGAGSSAAGGSGVGGGSSATTATATTAQIEVVSTGSFVANVSVDDTEVGELAVGNPATIALGSSGSSSGSFGGFGFAGRGGGTGATRTGTGAASPGVTSATTYTGTVASIASTASSSSGVSSYAVAIDVTGATKGLYIGSSVIASIVDKQVNDVIEVPTTAVHRGSSGSYVLKSLHGKVSEQAVTTGASAGGETQIVSGLQAGDQVQVTTVTRSSVGRSGTTRGGQTGESGRGSLGGRGGFTGGGGFPEGGGFPGAGG